MNGRPDERWQSEVGLRLQMGGIRGAVVHGITHHRITIHVVEARLLEETLPNGYTWVNPKSPGVGLSAYVKKVMRVVSEPRTERALRAE